MSKIGSLNEKPLHMSLKEWYAQPGDQLEVMVDGFVIDIVQDDRLIEIQTKNLASIKPKLITLANAHKIRLIYPIAEEKWIIRLPKNDSDGVTRRKSPRRGRIEDMFLEMVSIPRLFQNPNFSFEVLFIREEEVRMFEEKKNWRRKGWGIKERRLLEVVDRRLFKEPADLRALLPEKLEEFFTVRDLSKASGISRQLAQRMTYCLHKAKVIELTGRQGRANLYKIAGV